MSENESLILVVDDNEMNRDLLSRRLHSKGHKTRMAEDGQQALDSLKSEAFDLVLLDYMMPKINGYQVLREIKSDPNLQHIPVIMISALSDMEGVTKCIEAGADDYLFKPFKPALLGARVRSCLEKKYFADKERQYREDLELEKKRSDDLLRVILPSSIVEELKKSRHVPPRLYQNVAVMFCDIVGFTEYCESHGPEEVWSYLQAFVEASEEISLKHQVQKIKTIGDAFMGCAGLFTQVTNPVLNCVRAGWDMIHIIKQVNPEWSLRVGIHIGSVVGGIVGHRQYLFDIWGDTVNTAERVQSIATPNGVSVTNDSWEKIQNFCEGKSSGPVPLKGKTPVEIYTVTKIK